MPVRITPFRAALHFQCPASAVLGCTRLEQHQQQPRTLFHSSPICRDDIEGKNHYELLNLQTNASPAEIKKSFYTLSKTHHPDHNPSDPNASRRFMRMSEAYSVLSNTDQRAKYDRDVLRHHQQQQQQHHHPPPRGSYSSTGPAGGRPASGLSRRRGTFRGPPPSFYRSGGWGLHSAKRRAAHDESTASSGSGSGTNGSTSGEGRRESSGYTAYNAGGMGPGQEPFGKGSASAADIPHFDRAAQEAHTRRHARYEEIRAKRAASRSPFAGTGSDFGEFAGFFAVLAVLGVAVGLPYFVLRGWNTGKKGRGVRADREQAVKG